MRRAFEFLFALSGLVAVLPVIVLCMAAIRLTSPGPAIFRQIRVGLHERLFTCYKLRTMYADTRDTPSHMMETYAVTSVGRWLRRLKLDELPQLWNILRGEMSFVGPRPCLPSQVELITARRKRGLYAIRPGVTGVSQITGIDMSDPERLASSDAAYLHDMSFKTNMRIMLLTVAGAGRGDAVK